MLRAVPRGKVTAITLPCDGEEYEAKRDATQYEGMRITSRNRDVLRYPAFQVMIPFALIDNAGMTGRSIAHCAVTHSDTRSGR